MACPICGAKAANCDCTSTERELHEENDQLRKENDCLRAVNESLKAKKVVSGGFVTNKEE